MRRIGGHVSVAGGLETAIRKTQLITGNCMQIFAASPRSWRRTVYSSSECEEFAQAVKQLDLQPVFIHASYLINLASDKPELIEKSLDSLRSDLRLAEDIGAAGVVVHLGSFQKRSFDQTKQQVADLLRQLTKPLKQTRLLMENMSGQQGKIGAIEHLQWLYHQLNSDHLGICLDTAHLWAAGYCLGQPGEIDRLVGKLKQAGLFEAVQLIHLNDSKAECGSHRDLHENIGQGQIGGSGLKQMINQPEFDALPLILEVPGFGNKHKGVDKRNIMLAKQLVK